VVRLGLPARPEDLVRDDVRSYVAAALGDPDGVLIGDDTGFEKGGSCSAGVNEAGLDHYQVRLYQAWYQYITLAMLALAWLAVTRAALADDDVLATPANEIRRMFTALCGPPLVTMAPPPSATLPSLPLPATTTPRSLNAAGGPGARPSTGPACAVLSPAPA
jgi:hypothetical protein